jgi:hypothetical protein
MSQRASSIPERMPTATRARFSVPTSRASMPGAIPAGRSVPSSAARSATFADTALNSSVAAITVANRPTASIRLDVGSSMPPTRSSSVVLPDPDDPDSPSDPDGPSSTTNSPGHTSSPTSLNAWTVPGPCPWVLVGPSARTAG